MVIYLIEDGKRASARLPFAGADHVVVDAACPACNVEPLKVRGAGIERKTHDSYSASALALCCGARLGEMVAEVSTIFGVEEDERVLNGRCRVY